MSKMKDLSYIYQKKKSVRSTVMSSWIIMNEEIPGEKLTVLAFNYDVTSIIR